MSEHAKYSPSSAEQWVNCPGSVPLSIGIPRKDSLASVEGTNAHSLLERKLLGLPITKSFKTDIEWNSTMATHVNRVHEIVKRELKSVTNEKNLTFKAEMRSDCSELVGEELWGTSDVNIIEEFGILKVGDLKYGKKKVKAKNNLQGLAYLLGIAHKYNYNFEGYQFQVYQPRNTLGEPAKKVDDIYTYTYKDLVNAKKIFRSAIAESKKRKPRLAEGPWCWFCPASKTCPLKEDKRIDEAREYFD